MVLYKLGYYYYYYFCLTLSIAILLFLNCAYPWQDIGMVAILVAMATLMTKFMKTEVVYLSHHHTIFLQEA